MQDCLAELGGEHVDVSSSPPAAGPVQASGDSACGWEVAVFFLGSGRYERGQVCCPMVQALPQVHQRYCPALGCF